MDRMSGQCDQFYPEHVVEMEIQLDVSMLEPCEPLEKTLEAIKGLCPGDYLRVLHRREPHLLYPLLEKSGYSWRCRDDMSGGYEIFIWKTDDAAATVGVDSSCS